MSKLFKLKPWLTVPNAARHLSIVLEEEVTEADVLHFALDGQLRLSVDLVNDTYARLGKMVPISEAEYREVPSLDGIRRLRLYNGPTLFYEGQESHVVELEKRLVLLSGVYDLSMIGSEGRDLKAKYYELAGGPAVTAQMFDGAFVNAPDGQVCQLQEDFDQNVCVSGSRADLEELKQHIVDKNIGMAEAEVLLNHHKQERKKFLERRKTRPALEQYYPADLPWDDCVLVVRTDALREFEQRLDGSTQNQKPESTRKTENLLRALTCIAIDAYGYDPRSGKNTAPREIADALNRRGFAKDEKTIRNWLKEGDELLPPIPHKD